VWHRATVAHSCCPTIPELLLRYNGYPTNWHTQCCGTAAARPTCSAAQVLQKNLELQAKRHEQEVEQVREEAERTRVDATNPKYLVQKLKGQLNSKDEKLRQLKEAIKQLEQKLVEKMKEAADVEMHKASWQDQEDLDE
jgi:septal ring factor EnvC (AmiA/AmiB activator)